MSSISAGWLDEYYGRLTTGTRSVQGSVRWDQTHWRSEYERRILSPEDAANRVKPGDRVAFTSGREAIAIGRALAARKDDFKANPISLMVPTPAFDFGWYDGEGGDAFDITVRMGTKVCQEALDKRRVDFDPGTLVPFLDLGISSKADVLVTEVSPPDDQGYCSFGNSLWAKKRQIEAAKTVIAEVNPRLIRTYGENYIHVSEIDYFVAHVSSGKPMGAGSLAGRDKKEPEAYLDDICGYVNGLIENGDTLQIGVGRTTEPLVKLGLLNGREDIGWHSEATPPGIISLIREGVINGKRKTVHEGKAIVTSLGGGSRDEMMWAADNPIICLVDVAYLEDPRLIAAHDNFVALNNALAVDLTGQVGAESIGQKQIGAAGGQIPFVIGSWLSRNGRSITVLPSTAGNGRFSRIVPEMPQGTVVTLQRNLTDYVVTEFGVAHLKGKSLRQRAEALIGISHPDFRKDLRKWAKQRFYP